MSEQLDPHEEADLIGHIETCEHCQQALERLTSGPVLAGLATDPGPQASVIWTWSTSLSSTSGSDSMNGRSSAIAPGPTGNQGRSLHSESPARPAAIAPQGFPSIPGYELLDTLGEGGMGVIYLARQTGLNRRVAVKMIRGGTQARSDHFTRFRIEAEAVARLRHPNIIQIHEIGEVDGLPFVSLELLEGGSLADRLEGTPQPARPTAELLITLARAVLVAHDVGIVHRDLKPSNVLFTEDGIPILTDFGLAKRIDSDSRQTETGQILGSPSYMAPEQARGHTREIGPAADVYALGAILYEMLTGRPPFKGETPMETVRQVVEDEVVPPSRLVPKVARDLETICLHCLKKEPAKRYSSARALAEDLESFLADRPIKARRTPFWERGVKLARRRPVAATLLALALAAALGGGGFLLRSSSLRQQRELQEKLRIAELNGNVLRTLLQSQQFLSQGKWSDAEIALTRVQAEIRDQPVAPDLARRTVELLEQAGQGRSAQEARSRTRELLRTFLDRRRDALFQETHFLWLGRPYEPEQVRARANSALAVFATPGSDEAWILGPLPESLTAAERDDVREGCYELLLVLAETEEPDRGLRVLDAAGRLRPASRAYHLRRADCHARRGDASAAEQERRAAEALPLASPLDHFLAAKDLYRRASWAEALAHFDSTLTRQPGHFWSNCLSAICCLQLQRPVPAWSKLT
ncbi:MAG: protein kinase domain-containing protein, partial [Isosphaeraceae bacterium]